MLSPSLGFFFSGSSVLQLFFFFPILCFLFSSALKVLLLVAAQLRCAHLRESVASLVFGPTC